MVTGTKDLMSSSMSRNVKKSNNVEDVAFDFGQMMNQSLNDMAGRNASESANAGKNALGTEVNFTQGTARVKSVSEDASKDAVKDTTDTTKQAVKEEKTVTDATKGEDKSQSMNEKGQALRDKIKDTMEVTDEEIDMALNNLGISLMDLVNPEMMTEFVVEVTGNESSFDLLTDSALSEGLFELQNFATELFTEDFTGIDADYELLAEDFNLLQEQQVQTEDSNQNSKEVNTSVEKEENGVLEDLQKDNVEKPTNTTVEIADHRTNQTKNSNASNSGQKHSFEGSAEQLVFGNLNQAVENIIGTQEVSGVSTYDAVSIVNQIVDAARVTLNDQISTMELLLNPEHLGRVSLSVSLKEGAVTAQIVAENESAKNAIESQIVMLKEQLNNQGLKIEAVEVTIASHSFEAGYQQESREQAEENSNNPKKNRVRDIDLSQLTEEDIESLTGEERLEAEMMAQQGNMVNYQA